MKAIKLEAGAEYALQQLAREQMIEKLLADILLDMNICELEGWNKFEFPERIKKEIDRICALKKEHW